MASTNTVEFELQLNAIMFETSLTDKDTSLATNELQEVKISSVKNIESYDIKYRSDFREIAPKIGLAERQNIVMTVSDQVNTFSLRFMGVDTRILNYGVSAYEIEKALNDLPTLQPNLVFVTETFSIGE